MAENVYEGMFILDSNKFARDPGAVSGQIAEMVEKCGGTMLVSRLWEERRLAYPIDGHRKGTYWLTYFRVGADQISVINRECEISDTVIRSLVLKVDPRIVDALVQHALSAEVGGGTRRSEAAPVAVGVADGEVEEEVDEIESEE